MFVEVRVSDDLGIIDVLIRDQPDRLASDVCGFLSKGDSLGKNSGVRARVARRAAKLSISSRLESQPPGFQSISARGMVRKTPLGSDMRTS